MSKTEIKHRMAHLVISINLQCWVFSDYNLWFLPVQKAPISLMLTASALSRKTLL